MTSEIGSEMFGLNFQVAKKKKITKNNENDDWTKKRKKKHEIHTNGRPSIWAVFFLLSNVYWDAT